MQPRLGRRAEAGGVRGRGREPRLDRRAVDAHARARRARAYPRPRQRQRAVDAAHAAGIDRVNLDLIYGSPCERVEDWEATLDAALALGPTHVSAYALTVEPGTPLGAAVAAGTRVAPDDDDQALKYEIADDRLAAAGFEWYEISNWARPAEECRHNLLYWQGGEYAGVGCAAHGHTLDRTTGASRRWWNVRTPERYVAGIDAGRSVEAGSEALDEAQVATERLVLGLRTRAGIKLDARRAEAPGVHDCIDALADAGLLDRTGDHVRLTRRGRLLANEVGARLLAAAEVDASPARHAPGTQ